MYTLYSLKWDRCMLIRDAIIGCYTSSLHLKVCVQLYPILYYPRFKSNSVIVLFHDIMSLFVSFFLRYSLCPVIVTPNICINFSIFFSVFLWSTVYICMYIYACQVPVQVRYRYHTSPYSRSAASFSIQHLALSYVLHRFSALRKNRRALVFIPKL